MVTRASFLCLLLATPPALATGAIMSAVPNSSQFGCQACHPAGTSLNAFGEDLASNSNQWSLVFALDSDDDGYSNGDELGDPDGDGAPVAGFAPSHPSDASDTLCGDGALQGPESCDGDELGDATCTSLGLEAGPLSCGATCAYDTTACGASGPFCGDGSVDPTEECDNGLDNSNTAADSCRTNCRAASCGDGAIDSLEACDDGEANSDTVPDACRSGCAVPACGDGVTDSAEGCDDGNAVNDDACSNTCAPAGCGDGEVLAPEQCDDGNTQSGDGCSAACLEEACGDGVVQSDEECDDGNALGNDGCSRACALERCGDGDAQAIEQCDDGNNNDDDGCSSICLWELCRDGVVQAGEECDDGNRLSNDGCSTTCVLERCGDGIVQQSEGCDDGNGKDQDGCDSACVIEPAADGCASTGPSAAIAWLVVLFILRRSGSTRGRLRLMASRVAVLGAQSGLRGLLFCVMLWPLAACEPGGVTGGTDHLSPATHTSFPIRADDRHGFIECATCHNGEPNDFARFDCVQCHAGVAPVHERIVGFGLQSSVCYQCHFDGTTFPKDGFAHDPFPIERGGHEGIDCDSCHVPNEPRSVFRCTDCHGGETATTTRHEAVPGYSFDSPSCYACHPNGTG